MSTSLPSSSIRSSSDEYFLAFATLKIPVCQMQFGLVQRLTGRPLPDEFRSCYWNMSCLVSVLESMFNAALLAQRSPNLRRVAKMRRESGVDCHVSEAKGGPDTEPFGLFHPEKAPLTRCKNAGLLQP